MAKPNLDSLSLTELHQLRTDVDHAIDDRKKKAVDDIAEELRTKAEAAGISVDQVVKKLRKRAAGQSRTKGVAKYRHPQKSDLTWTGRGKRPKWIQELLEQGKSLESLEA